MDVSGTIAAAGFSLSGSTLQTSTTLLSLIAAGGGDVEIRIGNSTIFSASSAGIGITGSAAVSGNLTVSGRITASSNTAGSATILDTTDQVTITFPSAYTNAPIVSITPIGDPGASWMVTNVTVDGFTIQLPAPTNADRVFHWIAVEPSS
jgi:hypothetical protein